MRSIILIFLCDSPTYWRQKEVGELRKSISETATSFDTLLCYPKNTPFFTPVTFRGKVS